MLLRCLWFCLWVCLFEGFCSVHALIPPFTPIRLIVTGEAFTSSLTENFYREFPENLVMTTVFKTRFHPELDILYLGLIALSMYSRYQNIGGVGNSRWSTVPGYSKIHKCTNMFLLFIMLVLTKNVENAI
jgi:hypothetical protein